MLAIVELFLYPSFSSKKHSELWPASPLEQFTVVSLASLCVRIALELLEEFSVELLETVSELLNGVSLEQLCIFTALLVGLSAELLEDGSLSLSTLSHVDDFFRYCKE